MKLSAKDAWVWCLGETVVMFKQSSSVHSESTLEEYVRNSKDSILEN